VAGPHIPRKLAILLRRQGRILEEAFLAAIEDLRQGINWTALIKALERGDLEAAVAALDIDIGAFSGYLQAKTTTYAALGATVMAAIPPPNASISFRFNLANPRAEAWLAANSSERVVGLIASEIQKLRMALLAGYSQGQGSQTLATTIAGRINPVTKKREGGLVGLSDPQVTYVKNMRARLQSGDPVEMQKVLDGMTLRDKRFDAAIKKHIASGTPVPPELLEKMTTRYSARLLKRRAEDIARLELGQAVEAARKEAFLQAATKAGYPVEAISREWVHGGDGVNARPDHVAMHGQVRKGVTEPFVMDDMSPKIHAMDGVGGPKQDGNCRCSTRWIIDYTYGLS
jgi:hypothetical protein